MNPADRELLRALATLLPGTLQLRKYQVEAVRHCRAYEHRALVADEMGLGKSPVAISCLLAAPATTLPATIVVPKSLTTQWRAELARWCPGIRVLELKRGAATVPPGFKGIVLTKCGLLVDQVDMLVGAGIRTAILDEAHAYKDPEAQRSLAARALCTALPNVLLLTGTPMPNNERELHALYDLIAKPGESRDATAKRMIRRTSEDVGDALPPLLGRELLIEPSPEALAEYREVEAQTRRELAAKGLDGKAVRSKIAALMQMTTAMKLEPVAELVAASIEAEHPVLCFAQYRATAGAMLGALKMAGVRAAVITGENTQTQRAALMKAFQDGEYDALVCTNVLREGANLPRARVVVHVERDWVPDYERQKTHRARRATSTGPVHVVFPRVPDTIDDRMAEVCAEKDARKANVLGRLRGRMLEEVAARPALPSWASAGGVRMEADERLAALLFDLDTWTGDEIKRWCRLSAYAPLASQRLAGDKLMVRLRQKRPGIEYALKQIRPGVVAVVERARYARPGGSR